MPCAVAKAGRPARLKSLAGRSIPGGPERYLDILARQVESRRGLLQAISAPPSSDEQAAERVAIATAVLIDWWKVHDFVLDGGGDEPFQWSYVPGTQVTLLREWCRANVKNTKSVTQQTARLLESRGVLPLSIAQQRIADLLSR